MTRSTSPRRPCPPSAVAAASTSSVDPDTARGEAAVAFKAEIAALEALDDVAFGDVLLAGRQPIVARVVARGRVEP
jgi:hypothetical protein